MSSGVDVDEFIERGFTRLPGAFPRPLADRCRSILWTATGCDESEPSTWRAPVVRVPYRDDPPFVEAVNTPRLHAAFDRLAGRDRWFARPNVGTFPIRFPHAGDPGDDGWHIDASFQPPGVDATDFLHWRVNVRSDGKVLLLLMLFSDVDADDAPTRLRVGSHLEIARRLVPFGEEGADVFDLMPLPEGEIALATGEAGDVYLCHPFVVHAAQPHRGTRPRFLAQPPLHQRAPLELDRERVDDHSPVELAIRRALEDRF